MGSNEFNQTGLAGGETTVLQHNQRSNSPLNIHTPFKSKLIHTLCCPTFLSSLSKTTKSYLKTPSPKTPTQPPAHPQHGPRGETSRVGHCKLFRISNLSAGLARAKTSTEVISPSVPVVKWSWSPMSPNVLQRKPWTPPDDTWSLLQWYLLRKSIIFKQAAFFFSSFV